MISRLINLCGLGALLAFLGLPLQAANKFVRFGATGANTGADWVNAFNTPLTNNAPIWALINAGDVIWIAGGDQYSMEVMKNGLIIKRATAANPECTSAAGWNAAYDAQVVITVGYATNNAAFTVLPPTSDNITIDGQLKNGIKAKLLAPTVDVNTQTAGVTSGVWCVGNSNTFQNIEVEGPGTPSSATGFTVGDNYHFGRKTNVTIRNCNIHGCSNGLQLGDTDQLLVEGNEISSCYGNLHNHDNCTFMFGLSDNGVFRFNTLHNFDAMGIYLNAQGPPGPNHWKIYGNVVYNRGNDAGNGQGLCFDAAGSTTPWQMGGDFQIYNNTFANLLLGLRTDSRWPMTYNSAITGGVATNNIFWAAYPGFGIVAHDYNFSDGALGEAHGISSGSQPFVDLSASDFHIVPTIGATWPRNKGAVLASEFNTDPAGNSRVGLWSQGALEIPGAGTPGSIQVSASAATVSEASGTITITLQRIGGSSGAVGVSYATINGSAAAGTNYVSTVGSASWLNGDAADKTFTVTINDLDMVGNKDFTLQLSSPTGGATLGTSVETITITGTGAPATCVLPALSWEAEAACSIVSPMQLGTNNGTVYAYQPSEIEDPAIAGKADFTFTNSAGSYRIKLKVDAADGGRNSYSISTNNGAADICDIVQFTRGFENRWVSLRRNGTYNAPQYPDAVFQFPAGTNTITIYGREANTLLDSVTLEPVFVGPPPVIRNLTTSATNIPPAHAAYRKAGAIVPITVTWSLPVTITGSPRLTLTGGGVATYTSGSGTTNTVFTYTVGSENTPQLDVTLLDLNGGTIQNNAVDADPTLPQSGAAGSLSANQLVVVDTIAPTVRIEDPPTRVTFTNDVPFQVTFSDSNLGPAPGGIRAADVTLIRTGSANATLAFSGSPAQPTVTLTGISGAGTLCFSLNPGTCADLAGNSDGGAAQSAVVSVESYRILVIKTFKTTNAVVVKP